MCCKEKFPNYFSKLEKQGVIQWMSDRNLHTYTYFYNGKWYKEFSAVYEGMEGVKPLHGVPLKIPRHAGNCCYYNGTDKLT